MKKVVEEPITVAETKNIFITASDPSAGSEFFVNSDERLKVAEIYRQFEMLNSLAS